MKKIGKDQYLYIDESIANHLFNPFDPKIKVKKITPLLEGKRNSNYVVHVNNSNIIFLLRIYAPDEDYWKKEEALLSLLKRSDIPIHKLYFLAQDESIGNRDYAIYNYVQGISLSKAINFGYNPENKLIKRFV